MANNDSSQYVLRFNEVSQVLEYAVGLNWVPVPSSGLGANVPVTTLSINSTATQPGVYIWPASSTITLTLPDATTVKGNVYYFNGGAATTATVHPVMSQTVDGASGDLTITSSEGIVSDGANWFTI